MVQSRRRPLVGEPGLSSHGRVNPEVDREINPIFNPCADDEDPLSGHDCRMTTTDYLINAVFVLLVLRQVRSGSWTCVVSWLR